VLVEKQGFQKALKASIDIGVNQVARVDMSLRIGSPMETMAVSATPPLLQTEASSLGTIETERRISELPLNGRNFLQLAYLRSLSGALPVGSAESPARLAGALGLDAARLGTDAGRPEWDTQVKAAANVAGVTRMSTPLCVRANSLTIFGRSRCR